MSVAIFEGTVENGLAKLPKDAHVPDRTKVVGPEATEPLSIKIMSPRLANPEQSKDFEIEVIPNASL